ncbi:MAG: ATP-binding protein, partial [Lachnospiraceae bacterium]|nr:ATP-binding protein [Lachnospiraceae bacterium]
FFVTLFDDVNKACYHREEKNGKIRYSLFLNKRIENRNFDIDFMYESSRTQEILSLLPYLMVVITGKCVIIDEFGNGIHDLLAAKLMKAVARNIKGQLIFTTHNTLIMDHSDIKPDALYFIFNEIFGKKVKCVTDIEERLYPNYNYRN